MRSRILRAVAAGDGAEEDEEEDVGVGHEEMDG